MYTFRQEKVNDSALRFYLVTGGKKYYLSTASNGNITALNADDLSQSDIHSTFRRILE